MNPDPATKTSRPRAISGWVLDHLIALDAANPGILRFTLQASPLRRQGIFLTLAHLRRGSAADLAARLSHASGLLPSADPLAVIASALMEQRVRDIVQRLHPGVDGLMGALNKLGSDPFHPLKYRMLVSMLAEPDQRRAKVLKQMRAISETTLSVLRVIDPAFLHPDPDFIQRFRSTASVRGFNSVVDLIRRVVPNVTDADLFASVRALGPTSSLDGWAQRWVAKAAKFPMLPPIHDDEEWRVLGSGDAMQEAAARFRNCLRDKISVCALGRAAYIEWRSEPAIIELIALSGAQGNVRYAVQGVHGYRNARVAPGVIDAICAKAAAAGFLLSAKLGHARKDNRAAQLLGVFEFDGFWGLPDPAGEALDEILDEIAQEAQAA
jgi:hypothetical protein